MAAKTIARCQGWYYLATGLLPLFAPDFFQQITGPKIDFWLVVTVGLLLTASGTAFVLAARSNRVTPEVMLLGFLEAAALGGVDLYLAYEPRTTVAYQLEAVIEGGVVLLWTWAWLKHRAARLSG